MVICDLKPSCLSLEGVDVLELLDMHESDEARARLLIDGMENFVGVRKTLRRCEAEHKPDMNFRTIESVR